MPLRTHPNGTCSISGKSLPRHQLIPLQAIRPEVAARLLKLHPDLPEDALISRDEVNTARIDFVRELMQKQLGELSDLDQEVISSLRNHELLSERPSGQIEEEVKSSLGDRVADKIASFGGSWRFILSFIAFLLLWIAVNAWVLVTKAFDPFPFILLNLILSCLAAIQAPVIMMSQNRQESRDRKRAENDYKINLKAELEIRHLHEKIDYLLHQQATRLMEVQQIQLDLMREMANRSHGK